MSWGGTYNRHKAKGMDANDAAFRADQSVARKQEPFPQPSRNDGGKPCGECHLNAGETCDICGAVNLAPIPAMKPDWRNPFCKRRDEKVLSNVRDAYFYGFEDALEITQKSQYSQPNMAALLDALRNLERANDTLCGARPQKVYDAMIAAGMADRMTDLDEARRAARAILTTPAPAQNVTALTPPKPSL